MIKVNPELTGTPYPESGSTPQKIEWEIANQDSTLVRPHLDDYNPHIQAGDEIVDVNFPQSNYTYHTNGQEYLKVVGLAVVGIGAMVVVGFLIAGAIGYGLYKWSRGSPSEEG